ncbi:MAG: DNA topoisomerase IV subunit A [Kiritimatiellae bacterium]|jgi:topoisomerase-4 subunit A|nr:DNA topoisomerase IV subunit A [Kiritimatiellia bacterium]
MSDPKDPDLFPKDEPDAKKVSEQAEDVDAELEEESNVSTWEGDEEEPVLKDMVDFNFLEYAAYVIKDRAIPSLEDGLKPVQRRIMWSLFRNDDGKFIKVANIVGFTMQFHPHGDASIADALVTLVNKRYLIEGQGNYGNLHTGDPAAASRYIECRLTPLARDQVFNKHLTKFIPSYDGRNEEPVLLPSKIPLLLMLGAEGIAVGLATRILPHNFGELLSAQISVLKKRSFKLLHDFLTGGVMDAGEYDLGRGKVKVRAVIEKKGKDLIIRELPFNTTTEQLIKTIEDAIRKKKIKIRSIQDYTAEKVELHLNLVAGQDPDETIQKLFAFTDCEISVNSSIMCIESNRPVELTVNDVVRKLTDRLLVTLEQELEWEKSRLLDEFHNKTLVQLFIENRIYKNIEECKTYALVQKAVLDGVNKFRDQLRRDVTMDDVEMLLGVRIKRISRFDMDKNRKDLEDILIALEEVEKNLKRIVDYAVDFLKMLKKKYAGDYPRRTQIDEDGFKKIEVRKLTASELKLRYDKPGGYLGHNMREGDEVLQCSSLDKIIVVWRDGRYQMMAPPEKLFVGKDVEYVGLYDRDKEFLVCYTHNQTSFIKRFTFGGCIQNKDYNLCPKGKNKLILFEEAGADLVFVKFAPMKNQRVHQQLLKVADYQVKGAKTKGNQITMKKVQNISTKKPRNWDDESDLDPNAVLDF